MDRIGSANFGEDSEMLPEEQIEKIEEEFRKRMAERGNASKLGARSLLDYPDEPTIGASLASESLNATRSSITADVRQASPNHDEASSRPETVLTLQDVEGMADALLSSRISNSLKLTPKVVETLESLGCVTVGSLIDLKVSDFIAKRGISMGKVGSVRVAFRKWAVSVSALPADSSAPFEIDPMLEPIIPSSLYGKMDERKKKLPIRGILNLTLGVYRALESIGCKAIGDLFETKASAFVSMDRVSLGKLGSLRKEFKRWMENSVDDSGAISEAMLGSGSTLITVFPEMQIPSWLLESKVEDVMRLTPSIRYALKGAGCELVEDLLHTKTEDFLKCDRVGGAAVSRIRKAFIESLPSGFAEQTASVICIAKDLHTLVGDRYVFDAQLSRPVELSELKHPSFIPIIDFNDGTLEIGTSKDAVPEPVPASKPLPWMRRIRLSWLSPKQASRRFDDSTIADELTGESDGESRKCVEAAIGVLDSLWRLTGQADSAEQLIAQCLVDSNSKINARSISIFMQREASAPQKKLQEVADEQGITRERVRQLALKISNGLDFKASRRFFPVRLVILAAALDLGGSGTTTALSRLLEHADLPLKGNLLALVAVSPDITIDKSGETFSLTEHPCQNCDYLASRVRQLKKAKELIDLEAFYRHVGCYNCALRPSATWLEGRFAGIGADKNRIGSIKNPSTPSTKHPRKSERAIVRSIMYEAEGALNYDQIVAAFHARTGKTASRSKISSYVGSMEDCLLWGRGTYIHESKISFPVDLICRIAGWACEQFSNRRIPILGIGGIFDHFEKELASANIPSQHALYSLLRRVGDPRLELREYPWVCESLTIGERTSFAKYFYWVLEQNNGFITDAHAEGIANRAMAQSFALGGLAEYSPFLINANGGWYDIEAADFDMEGVANLARDIAARMREDDIISTVKVFEDNKERCMCYGVKSHDILYYLIDMMEDDLPIEATRRPHLVKSTHGGLSVLGAIRLYIKNSDCPVSIEELYEEFVTKRRLNRSGICVSIIVDDDIVEIGKGVFWSRNKMHVDDEFIKEFDDAVKNATMHSRKIASLYYPREELFPAYSGLPSLPGMRWSEELLAAVFSKSRRYKLLGEENKCLIDMEENPDVYNAETFYHALLKNEFYGWSTFGSFVDYCNNRSIRRDLEPEFFDAFDTIKADEYSIEAL